MASIVTNKRDNRRALLLIILLLTSIALFSSVGHALLIDQDQFTNTALQEKISLLELQSRKTIVVAITKTSTQPFDDGVSLLQEHQADLVVLYRYQENKIAVIQPIDAWLSDAEIKEIIDKHAAEKEQAITPEEKNSYIIAILDEITPLLIAAKDTRSYCAAVKDGYCDPKCEGIDMDCLCGDAICQYHEVKATCSADCGGARETFCSILRDGICDENCKRDIDCGFGKLMAVTEQVQQKTKLQYSTILGILYAVFLAASVVFGFLLYQERQQKKERKS
ncbi:hypothetical protein HYS47_03550 [Candidatus Woesearchaeota archaeon]|nr:hypothetical protein [Candidatus Woesearchaeota archaeon]